MRFRELALTSFLALAAVALAAPSMASANWLHDHEPIVQDELIELTGELGFGSAASGTTCEVHAVVEATKGSTTGHLIDFETTTHDNCIGTGVFAGCEVESTTITNSKSGKHIDEDPLPVHIADHHLTLTDLTIDTFYTHPEAECNLMEIVPITGKVLHFPEVTLFDADDGDSITVNTLGARGAGEITLYSSTAAQEANMPFLQTATEVNTEASELSLTEANTWGWDGTS